MYDATSKFVLPHAPAGTQLSTDRARGLLQLVYKKRYFPILQIQTENEGRSYTFVERRGRWSIFKLPDFVTEEMLAKVKAEACTNELFI